MKTKVMFFMITIMFVALFGSQMVSAESYQRWITFGQPGHIMTASEMADITASLSRGEISSQNTYRLSTGITYKIPQPDLFLQYIVMCVKEGEPTIVTNEDVVREIQSGEVVRWGNDISARVRNYFFSSLYNKVEYNDDYSGNDVKGDVWVLLIHRKPKIKMDCGNPLWIIGGDIIQTPPQVEPTPTPSITPPQKTPTYDLNLTFKPTVKLNLYFPPAPKERKKVKIWIFVIPIAAIVGGIYLLTKKKKSSPVDNGVPGGAPVTRPVVVPPVVTPVVPPVDPGGPGGAPTTK